VRVLFARAPSWPVFALGAVASLCVRTAVLALFVGRGLALRVYAIAFLPAMVAGALQYSALAALYHWLFWVGLGVVVATFLGVAPVLGLWGRSAYLLVLALLSALAGVGGSVASIALIIPSALVTAAALIRHRFIVAVVRPRVVLAGAAALVVAGAVWVVVDPLPSPAAGVRTREGSLLLIAGHGTRLGLGTLYHLDPADLGYSCEQTFYFSYRGRGAGARQREAVCPIRTGSEYARDDTRRSLRDLASLFEDQVRDLDPPVVVIGHSQGGWVAWQAITGSGRSNGVEAIVLLGPLPHTAVEWHAPGEDALGWVMRFARARRWTSFSPDDPLPRESLGERDALERLFGTPLPRGVRAIAVTPMLDLAVLPEGHRVPGTVDSCPRPVTHSGLVKAPDVLRSIRHFLANERLPSCPPWAELPGRLVHAYGVPADS